MRQAVATIVLAISVAGGCTDPLSPIDPEATEGEGEGTEGEGEVGEGEGEVGEGEGEVGEGEGEVGEGEGEGESVVRFVALGDTGEGNPAQYAVADAMATVCAVQGCDFALLLGDNFYDTGVDGNDDVLWQERFELPYENLDFPFYAVLGNHDGGAFGSGLQLSQGGHQVEYAATSDKWNMPARYYKHSMGPVDFFGLDTSSMFFADTLFDVGDRYSDLADEQAAFLDAQWAGGSLGTWRFAFAHHPYLSNGPHGNAGAYEGFDELPIADGESIKTFMDNHVCGQVDFYLCGHDHSRQWLVDTCDNTQLIVSGAGSKLTAFEGEQATHFQDDQHEGFVWFEVRGDTVTVEFYDRDAVRQHEATVTKATAP